ncbi:hypothetical protein [Heyndrickxia oleronia]|jgi:hypothetical protein|uniref:hypothetical protein n=1 Tax=Heyndrickxia oleronia TaxID=38875 RepID=UPI00242F73CA|nr:hypothetical protein [Heyndrickxia oleronia]MCI1763648.1 hypothetical protein [Heyndrickxia oleronia]
MKGHKKENSTKSIRPNTHGECVPCKKTKPYTSGFYLSNNELHISNNNRFPYCKKCLKDVIDINDIETVYDILMQMDRPFLFEVWNSSIKEAEKTKKDLFGIYYKNLLLNHKTLKWRDSVLESKKDNAEESKVNVDINSDYLITTEIMSFWGSGYSSEQYSKLSIFWEDMKNSYEIETASHKDYLKKICIVSLKMEEALADSKIDHFKKLSDAYDKLMHSAKFTAVQRSAADRTGGLNTFSEFFEYIEKEGFIPKFHTNEPQDIVDETIKNLMNYTKNLILGDPNIGGLVETALQNINEKEEVSENCDLFDVEEEEYYGS